MLLAPALTACFLIASISAYRAIRRDNIEGTIKTPQLALNTAVFVVLIDASTNFRWQLTRFEYFKILASKNCDDGKCMRNTKKVYRFYWLPCQTRKSYQLF